MNETPKADWLAICSIDGVCGSFARGPDRDEVLRRLPRKLREDWGTMFKFPEILKAALIDVNGYQEVYWGSDGIFSTDAEGKTIRLDQIRPVEIIDLDMTRKKN